jgi:Cof subfamily protein (haloacid dehalogenase superfamily)
MKYKLLILDVDETIITEKIGLSQRLKKDVAEVQKKGILVTLITGRMYRTTLPFAKELHITLPIICYQGALIKNPLSNKLISHEPVPLDLAREVVEIAKQEKAHLNIYLHDSLYMTKPKTPEAKEYLRIEKQNKKSQFHYINLKTFTLKESPTKLIIISNIKTINKIERKAKKIFKNQLTTTRGFPKFLDFLKFGVSKGKALKILVSYLGIKKKEIISIGDYLNDIPLFLESGFSVAVKNAPKAVKDKASYVTDSVENDGAAKAIEKFLLKNH